MNEIFVVHIEAAPDGVRQSLNEFGGAYINVYTTEIDIRSAIEIAEREVTDLGWRVDRVVSAALNAADDFPDEASGRQYYEQALVDGLVIVVHTFPPHHAESEGFH